MQPLALLVAASLVLQQPEGPALDDERAPTAEDQRAREDACWESDDALAWRRQRLRLGLVLPGLGVTVAGLLTFGLARDWDRVEETPPGKICMIGKPCGDTCIAVEYECHVGRGSARYAPLTTAGWVAGSLTTAVGIGLMLAGLFAPARLLPRRLKCSTSGCALVVRF